MLGHCNGSGEAGCVIFHRRQLLLRDPRIPLSSLLILHKSPAFTFACPLPPPSQPIFFSYFSFLHFFCTSPQPSLSARINYRYLSFSLANDGNNVCRGHATEHSLHDLRFADLYLRTYQHMHVNSNRCQLLTIV